MSQDGLLRAVYAALRTVLTDSAGDAVMDRDGSSIAPRIVLATDALSEIPQIADAEEGFPYTHIMIASHLPWDTKTSFGFRSVVRVTHFSRAGDYDEINEMMEEAYMNLHHRPLSIERRDAILVRLQNAFTMDDPDGRTKMGVQEFVVLHNWAPEIGV